MTEINLMPPVLVEKKKGQWRNVIIVLVLSTIVLLLAAWYAGLVMGIKQKEAKLEKINAQIVELQPYLTEIKQLESDIKEKKKRVEVIIQLDKGRFIWARLLDEMAECIPSGLWLNTFTNTQENLIDLDGKAFDNFSIANFMNNLMNSENFTNVVLGKIESTVIEKYPIKTFSIKCNFR